MGDALYTGKTAIITGSTQGLGEAIARKLTAEQASGITISGRNSERGKALAEELIGVTSMLIEDIGVLQDVGTWCHQCLSERCSTFNDIESNIAHRTHIRITREGGVVGVIGCCRESLVLLLCCSLNGKIQVLRCLLPKTLREVLQKCGGESVFVA